MAEFQLPKGLNGLPSFNLVPQKVETVEHIPAEQLRHYAAHPFELYQDERKTDMVKSIEANGILTPLIVRRKDDCFEILSGHNRFECGKEAGLTEFPCVIKDVTDQEAEQIVLITNLYQRGLEELPHSERAKVIKAYYETVKVQGKRNDLISDVKKLLENADKADEINENSTSYLLDKKLQGLEKTKKEYSLSSATISRYLRIAELSKDFSRLLDNGEIGIYVGVELSYLSDAEQDMVYRYITENGLKIDMKKAKAIKELSKQKRLNDFSLPSVWQGKTKKKAKSENKITLKRRDFAEYFDEEDTAEDIEDIIKAALEFYFEHQAKDFDEDDLEME